MGNTFLCSKQKIKNGVLLLQYLYEKQSYSFIKDFVYQNYPYFLDVNVVDNEGKNALFYALYDSKIVEFLLTNTDLDVNKKDSTGKNALFYTIDEQIVTTLIDKGIDVSVVDENGENILFFAMLNEQFLKTFIKKGLNINIVNKQGNSYYNGNFPLHYLEILVKNGYNIKHIDRNGMNILFHYIQRPYNEAIDIMRFLVNNGVSINQTDVSGKSLIDYTNDIRYLEFLRDRSFYFPVSTVMFVLELLRFPEKCNEIDDNFFISIAKILIVMGLLEHCTEHLDKEKLKLLKSITKRVTFSDKTD